MHLSNAKSGGGLSSAKSGGGQGYLSGAKSGGGQGYPNIRGSFTPPPKKISEFFFGITIFFWTLEANPEVGEVGGAPLAVMEDDFLVCNIFARLLIITLE